VARYIANQEQHHRRQTFRAEIVGFLSDNDIPFNPDFLYHDPI